MIRTSLVAVLAVFAVGTWRPLPSLAEAPATPVEQKAAPSYDRAIIPAGTVISVMHQQGGLVPVKKKEATPLQLVVAESVSDASGKVLIHAGTPVIGQMAMMKGKKAQIEIAHLVINNKLEPFQANSIQAMPVAKVPKNQISTGNDGRFLADSLLDAASTVGFNTGGSVLYGVAGNVGSSLLGAIFNSGPKTIKVVEMAAGQRYLVVVDAATTVAVATRPPTVLTPSSAQQEWRPDWQGGGLQQPYPIRTEQQQFPMQDQPYPIRPSQEQVPQVPGEAVNPNIPGFDF